MSQILRPRKGSPSKVLVYVYNTLTTFSPLPVVSQHFVYVLSFWLDHSFLKNKLPFLKKTSHHLYHCPAFSRNSVLICHFFPLIYLFYPTLDDCIKKFKDTLEKGYSFKIHSVMCIDFILYVRYLWMRVLITLFWGHGS